MTARARRITAVVSAALAVAVLVTGCGSSGDKATAGDGTALKGTLTIAAGDCSSGTASSGSFFRMVQPGGTVEKGPFVSNGDSPCRDKTWTPLAPGTDGGLVLGAYQPQPATPFDAKGNSTSAAIVAPQKWFAVAFGLATNEKDPQTGKATTPPTLRLNGKALTGDLSAFAASWNGQFFNQGAPKPGGGMPGATSAPTGTLDEATGNYTLTWTSQIVGGPFNNFTGVWHLEGAFEKEGSS